jgi:putative ABC transport system permease protein
MRFAPLPALYSAQFLSAFADNMILFITLEILKLNHYPDYYLPFVQGSFFLAYLVLAPWVGRIADRHPKARVLLLGNILKAVGILLMFIGVDPAREERVARLARFIREGRYPEPGQPEVLMGQRLLDKLGLKVGQRFTLVANTAFGSLNGRTLRVVGSIVSGLPFLDDRTLYMPIDEAQNFVDLNGGVTEIVAFARSEGEIPAVAKSIQAAIDSQQEAGRYVAQPYYVASPLMSQMNLGKVIYNAIYGIIILLASFVIMNTMWMIVSERTREIGALGALGFTKRQISLLFMYEAAALGFVGSLLGVMVGGTLTKILSITGIDFAKAVSGMDPKILYPTKIFPAFSFGILIFAMVLGTVIPMLAAYFPARRAQRLNPAEALRAV